MHKVGLWVELKHKQKQEGQYDTMEKSPASSMKLLNWCGIGSGCRGPSIKKGLTNVYILLNTFGNGRAPPSEYLMDLDLQPNKDGARC